MQPTVLQLVQRTEARIAKRFEEERLKFEARIFSGEFVFQDSDNSESDSNKDKDEVEYSESESESEPESETESQTSSSNKSSTNSDSTNENTQTNNQDLNEGRVRTRIINRVDSNNDTDNATATATATEAINNKFAQITAYNKMPNTSIPNAHQHRRRWRRTQTQTLSFVNTIESIGIRGDSEYIDFAHYSAILENESRQLLRIGSVFMTNLNMTDEEGEFGFGLDSRIINRVDDRLTINMCSGHSD